MTEVIEKKERAKRTPRSSEQIFKGALSLSLPDRVELVNKLKESITAEVETIKAAAAHAEKIANGSY